MKKRDQKEIPLIPPEVPVSVPEISPTEEPGIPKSPPEIVPTPERPFTTPDNPEKPDVSDLTS